MICHRVLYRLSIFLITIIVIGCSTGDEASEQIAERRDPIEFTTSAIIASRAGGTYINTTEFTTGSQIGVFGYYTGQSVWSTSATPNFMFNECIDKVSDGLWSYAPIKYWPNQTNDKVTFYGYYPYSGMGITLASTNTSPGLPALTFEVQELSENHVDFMLSELEEDEMHITSSPSQTSVNYKVVLKFHHTLSKIILKVKDESTGVFLPPNQFAVTISGWYDQGTCKTTTDNPWSCEWSDLSIDKDFTTSYSDDAEDEQEMELQQMMLLIPGELDGGMDPKIQFSYTLDNVAWVTTPIMSLNEASLTTWEPGMVYTYVYHISQQGNNLSVKVNPWYQSGLVFTNP